MTTLNSLGSSEPEPAEVVHASLAMADYDAKGGDYAAALDWLAVAAQFRVLMPEYRQKKVAWEVSLGPCDGPGSARACERGVRQRSRRRLSR
jgi:hypothetical protein